MSDSIRRILERNQPSPKVTLTNQAQHAEYNEARADLARLEKLAGLVPDFIVAIELLKLEYKPLEHADRLIGIRDLLTAAHAVLKGEDDVM